MSAIFVKIPHFEDKKKTLTVKAIKDEMGFTIESSYVETFTKSGNYKREHIDADNFSKRIHELGFDEGEIGIAVEEALEGQNAESLL